MGGGLGVEGLGGRIGGGGLLELGKQQESEVGEFRDDGGEQGGGDEGGVWGGGA